MIITQNSTTNMTSQGTTPPPGMQRSVVGEMVTDGIKIVGSIFIYLVILLQIYNLSMRLQLKAFQKNSFYKPNYDQLTYNIGDNSKFYQKEFENINTIRSFYCGNRTYIFVVQENKIFVNNEIESIGDFTLPENDPQHKSDFYKYLENLYENQCTFVVEFRKQMNALIFYKSGTMIIEKIFQLNVNHIWDVVRRYSKNNFKNFLFDLNDYIPQPTVEIKDKEKCLNVFKYFIYERIFNDKNIYLTADHIFFYELERYFLEKNDEYTEFFVNLFSDKNTTKVYNEILNNSEVDKKSLILTISFNIPFSVDYLFFYNLEKEPSVLKVKKSTVVFGIDLSLAFKNFFSKINKDASESFHNSRRFINFGRSWELALKEKKNQPNQNIIDLCVKYFYGKHYKMKFSEYEKVIIPNDWKSPLPKVLKNKESKIFSNKNN